MSRTQNIYETQYQKQITSVSEEWKVDNLVIYCTKFWKQQHEVNMSVKEILTKETSVDNFRDLYDLYMNQLTDVAIEKLKINNDAVNLWIIEK